MIDELPPQRLEDLRDLWLGFHRHHATLPLPPGTRVRDPDAAWEDWRASTTAAVVAGRAVVLVHRDGPELPPAGFAFALVLEHRTRPVIEPAGVRGELDTLAVDAAQRGRGIGEALLDAAVAWLRGRGVVAMDIVTRSSNAAALRLYRRRGAVDAFTTLALPLDPATSD